MKIYIDPIPQKKDSLDNIITYVRGVDTGYVESFLTDATKLEHGDIVSLYFETSFIGAWMYIHLLSANILHDNHATPGLTSLNVVRFALAWCL